MLSIRCLITALFLFATPLTLLAKNTGITGASGKIPADTCGNTGCHVTVGGLNPSVTISKKGTSIVPTAAVVGLSYEYTVQVTGTGIESGFNLATDGGVLSSTQSDVWEKNADGELTHRAPQTLLNGAATWDFVWQSPSTASTVTLYVCGNVTNANNNNRGDEHACGIFPITVNPLVADNTAPVFDAAADISVDAFAYLTPVDLPPVTATDNIDGIIGAVPDFNGPFRTGTTVVTWTATDASGNSAQATQNIHVKPMATMQTDLTLGLGVTYPLKLHLNGAAVSYPVDIPLTIAGTALASDYSISSTTVSVISNDVAEVSLNIQSGAIAARTVDITLDAPATAATPYVLGGHINQVITIVDTNMAPLVELTVMQLSNSGSVVELAGGIVTVTASAVDPEGNTLSYDWGASDSAILSTASLSINTNQLSFNPADVNAGVYPLQVSVTDNGVPNASAKASINIMVVEVAGPPPVSGNLDSDNDGIADDIEALFDIDYDGVADYLDFTDAAYILAISPKTDINSYIETIPGNALRVGDLSLLANSNGALVLASEITAANFSQSPIPSDMQGVYDIEAILAPAQDRSVTLTLPVSNVLPSIDLINSYNEINGWQPFVVDAENYFSYADSVAGICPAFNALYTLSGKDTKPCLAVVVAEGGPNDADGVVNGLLKLRIGSSGSVVIPLEVTPDAGGGSVFYLLLFAITWRAWRTYYPFEQNRKTAVL